MKINVIYIIYLILTVTILIIFAIKVFFLLWFSLHLGAKQSDK